MRMKTTMLALLLCCACWAAAQVTSAPAQTTSPSQTSQPPASASPQTSQPSASTSTTTSTTQTAGQATVQGCLDGSPMAGVFSLREDKTGKTFALAGGNDQLRTQVGEEVAVTGQPVSGMSRTTTANSSGETNTASAASASFQVTGVQPVSEHCTSKASETTQ